MWRAAAAPAALAHRRGRGAAGARRTTASSAPADALDTHRGTHALALSFSGSGMMMLWQMGVADVMRSDPSFLRRVEHVLGTSGGACAGAMLLASPPAAFSAACAHYTSGALWRSMQVPHDLIHPHEALLRRSVAALGLLPDDAWRVLRNRFSAHVTTRAWPMRNIGITDFRSNEEVLTAISASCCLLPHAAVDFRGTRFLDGGFSDPMPDACAAACGKQLPTVTISVLAGDGVDVAPGEASGRRGWQEGEAAAALQGGGRARAAAWRRGHVFLRYDASGANARALFDATVLPTHRAQWRFDQGRRDAVTFLRAIGHDPPPLPSLRG
eukprot:Tamp_19514.p1 GENE.Tamp_19514~~Tamp_19514.p1  ORF type:complete len:327 (+),score=65.49 Tamp_19514:264-1244(+)